MASKKKTSRKTESPKPTADELEHEGTAAPNVLADHVAEVTEETVTAPPPAPKVERPRKGSIKLGVPGLKMSELGKRTSSRRESLNAEDAADLEQIRALVGAMVWHSTGKPVDVGMVARVQERKLGWVVVLTSGSVVCAFKPEVQPEDQIRATRLVPPSKPRA